MPELTTWGLRPACLIPMRQNFKPCFICQNKDKYYFLSYKTQQTFKTQIDGEKRCVLYIDYYGNGFLASTIT